MSGNRVQRLYAVYLDRKIRAGQRCVNRDQRTADPWGVITNVPDHSARYQGRPRWITEVAPEKPVRQPLSRRRIVLAALAVAEQDGLGAVTMRQVAAKLEVTPMSLYNHVADKAELLDLMLDYVIGPVVREAAEDTGSWEDRLRAWVRRNHELWQRHPMFAQIYIEGVTIGPHGLANIERGLSLLREAGLGERDAADAFFVLWRYTLGSILVAPPKPVDPARRSGRSDGTPEGRVETYLSALPVAEIPNIVATAAHLTGGRYEFGLDLIICGLRDRIETSTTVVKPSGGRRRAKP